MSRPSAAIAKVYADPNVDVESRRILVKLLIQDLGNPKEDTGARDGILRAFADPDAEIRRMAVDASLRQGDAFARAESLLPLEPVYKCFHDPDLSVRASAQSVLERFVELSSLPGTFDPLKAAESGESGERYLAALALDPKKAGHARAMVKLARDPEPRVRRKLVDTLRRTHGTSETVESLNLLTTDADPGVRGAAAMVKASIGSAAGKSSPK